MPDFQLHPRLAADCAVVGDLPVSRLLLMNDRRFPWCILVPRRADPIELHHLTAADRQGVLDEIAAVSTVLLTHSGITKLNIGALGNLVPQLHVHVVGRSPADAAWPAPVWGFGIVEPYEPSALAAQVAQWKAALRL